MIRPRQMLATLLSLPIAAAVALSTRPADEYPLASFYRGFINDNASHVVSIVTTDGTTRDDIHGSRSWYWCQTSNDDPQGAGVVELMVSTRDTGRTYFHAMRRREDGGYGGWGVDLDNLDGESNSTLEATASAVSALMRHYGQTPSWGELDFSNCSDTEPPR